MNKLVLSMTLAITLAPACEAQILPDEERFDGSFRLDDGSIVTGGRFVEGGTTLFLYLDTDDPTVGAVFEQGSDETTFHSLPPYGGEAPNPGIGLRFKVNDDGSVDRLEWEQHGQVQRGQRIYPHRSTQVQFRSEDGTLLEGRLLEPLCAGPRPAVVPVHGSGPVNRYGGTFHLFFVREGMSALAYDKRGYTADSGSWHEPDIAEMTADATAAMRFLVGHDAVDRDRLGIMGSSQGGWTAPGAAVAVEETDFLIERAGAALSQAETFIHEVRQEWRAEGITGLDLDYAAAFLREALKLAEAGEPIEEVDALAEPYVGEEWYAKSVGEGLPSDEWSQSWWSWAQRNMASSPLDALARSDIPTLWFLGERDQNVPFVATRAALDQAFGKSPGKDETIVVIPNAPHSFIVPTEDGDRIVSPKFFSGMADWLEQRDLSDPDCWEG